MGNDLKRVGLVFKSDGTTDFVNSLKTINSSLKENYSQFKLTQTQWDNSTKNSQKLADKLKYLNEAYDLQNDKVTLLRKELEELEGAENKNQQAIHNKRMQLIQAETSLEKYNQRIKETSAMLKTGTVNLEVYAKKFKDAGKVIEDAGKKISKFSLVIGGALTASVKTAIDFEDSFMGVEKTVDATEEELAELRKGIRKLATEMPATTTEINSVAEAAGQLGIKTENVLSFTKTMIDLGEATNLSANEAADSLARFANITGMSQKDFDRLGSSIVALGNNSATTEAEIVSMAMRLAGAGSTVGMTESEIVGLAAALSSVGIEAEMGGSAFSKLMIQIEASAAEGFEGVEKYAKIAGMSAKDFAEAWEKDASSALIKFLEGLGNVEKNGGNLISVLDDLGIKEVRLRDSILRAANANELFADTIKIGNNAWIENNALSTEADKRYSTLKSKMQIIINKIKDMALTSGNKMMPSLEKILDKVGRWIDSFDKLSEEQVDLILKIGLFVAAAGPLITVFGKVTGAVGGGLKAIGTFSQAMQVAQGDITSTSATVNGLATIMTAVSSPIGIACLAIGASIAAISIASSDSTKAVKKDFETIGNAASDFMKGIDSATSHLNEFNTTLFASSEEQSKLRENMDSIQKGITEISRRASEERREYTEQEIKQLDEYFEELHKLKERELEIQSQVANAITQQATTIAETHKGSLEEYKITSQEWIKTAEEQAASQISIINQRTTEEIALLNVRYGERATIENEEYKREYDLIIKKKEDAINMANDEVAKVSEVYSAGFQKRLASNTSFMEMIKKANKDYENATSEHNKQLEDIENQHFTFKKDRKFALYKADLDYENKTREIWEKLYKNMSDSEAEQLGTWLAMVSNTELYGGKIDAETKKIVDGIIGSYDSMPKKTREAMKNAMDPMLDEMKKKEPSLFAKASSIANGILSKLKKAFDIHSPSKKTRAIFQNVMKGSELGIKDEEAKLYKQTDKIAKSVNDSFENIDPEINSKLIKNTYSNNTDSFDSQNRIVVEIDYNLLYKTFVRALNSCKMSLDNEGFVKFVESVLYKVV